jgi:hypothetical protein
MIAMGVFHGYLGNTEAMTRCRLPDFFGVIVSHHHRSAHALRTCRHQMLRGSLRRVGSDNPQYRKS